MCLSRVDCFVGLNWFITEWKGLAEEFWTAEKMDFKTEERTFRIQTAKS